MGRSECRKGLSRSAKLVGTYSCQTMFFKSSAQKGATEFPKEKWRQVLSSAHACSVRARGNQGQKLLAVRTSRTTIWFYRIFCICLWFCELNTLFSAFSDFLQDCFGDIYSKLIWEVKGIGYHVSALREALSVSSFIINWNIIVTGTWKSGWVRSLLNEAKNCLLLNGNRAVE